MTASLRLRDGVEWRAVAGRIVAMDVRTGRCTAMNLTGTRLWEALVRATTIDELVETLIAGYAIDEASARRDVEAFVAALRARDLLDS